MKDFLRDAKWFVFSLLVIAGLWFGPQVSDYFEGLERERLQEEKLQEEKRLAEIEKNKSIVVSDELFSKLKALEEKEIIGLICSIDGLYPLRLMIPASLDYIDYVERVSDKITNTHVYEIERIKDEYLSFGSFYRVEPKRITFYNLPSYLIKPKYGLDTLFYLNRESLALTAKMNKRYDSGNIIFDGSGLCTAEKSQTIRDFVATHNESIAKSNVL